MFLLFTAPVFAQTYQVIKPLEGSGTPDQGVYYKDYNNVLNGFEGTYEYTGTDFYFKIVLKKIFANNNNYWWTDMIVGKYQYIRNGVEISYLDDNLNAINSVGLKISADWINNPEPDFCPSCPSEKWLIGSISDPIRHKSAWLYIAKKTQNGEPGIFVWFHLEASSKQPWQSDEPIQLPIGEFFMKKVN